MNNNNLAISVENISKIYRIGTEAEQSEDLIGSFLRFVKNPVKNYSKYKSLYDFSDVQQYKDDPEKAADNGVLWALKDVSFDIKAGEVVGIIGRNGAGKSTLLKILSRITPPSTGKITTRGRISSLLEVGTGFHPELTGRENVYLNGTILGMRRKEIEQRFDEIVEFSGVERFLDTPVKRYSSGMRVRLAFAVAAHLEPEILIVDEVLAYTLSVYLFVSSNAPGFLLRCNRIFCEADDPDTLTKECVRCGVSFSTRKAALASQPSPATSQPSAPAMASARC